MKRGMPYTADISNCIRICNILVIPQHYIVIGMLFKSSVFNDMGQSDAGLSMV